MSELPSGLVTFVFTDIEGSTRLFHEFGTLYEQVLAEHNGLVRSAFIQRGGHELKSLGDGFFFAFGDADAGVAACIEGQRSLTAHSWPDSCEPRVRMGVHAADCSPVDDDYVSVGAHQAARIVAAAHGGQIVVSDVAVHLLDDVPAGASVRPLGVFRLKDFDDPIELFQISSFGLPAEFPAVRALPARAHNVGLSRRPLVGRETDAASVRDALDVSRLVTIVGPGGVGKTSLAEELVRALAFSYADGAWLVDLAPVSDGDIVVEVVSATLGVTEAGTAVLDSVLGWLGTRRLLLVVDNCEHLIDACGALVDAVMDRTTAVDVLATSREPLNVPGERVHRLEPLAVPDRDTDENVADAPAVRLFVDRAREARPGFDPSPADIEAASAVCRSVDGLPLAVEMAAAHVRLLSPAEVHEQLLRGATLRSVARSVSPRHRSLIDVIDWSSRLLSDSERAVFRGCAVFAGGFSLEAAEEVLVDCVPRSEIMSVLLSLYDKSLLQRSEGRSGTRFRMLEPVRHYCAGLLDDETRARLSRRHAAWALQFGSAARAGLRSVDQGAWLDSVGEERANLVASLSWMRDQGDRAQCSTLALDLAEYWFVRGSKREGLRWLSAVIDSDPDVSTLIAACTEAASLALAIEALDLAEQLAKRAVAAADDAGTPAAACGAWLTLGLVFWPAGEATAAEQSFTTAVRLARDVNDAHRLMDALMCVAQFELERDPDAARRHVAEAAHLANQDGNPRFRMRALDLRGRLAFDESRFADAASAQREALEASRSLGDRRWTAWLHNNRGRALTRLGEFREAENQLDAAIRIARTDSLQWVEAEARWSQAELARYRDDPQEAIAHGLQGLAHCLRTGRRGELDWYLVGLAESLVLAGQFEHAATLFGAAAAAREPAGLRDVPAVEAVELEAAQAKARAVLGTRYDELFTAGSQIATDDELRTLIDRGSG